MSQTAVVIGATGLTGSNLVTLLLHDDRFSKVKVLLRTPSLKQRPGLEPVIVDFNDEEGLAQALTGDAVFCCIGTTIRQAGSQEQFREVDFGIPVRCATIARRQGVKQFLLMSSIGANAASKTFYLRTKGETENAIMALAFPGYHIFRPSILVGARKEFRFGEWFGYILTSLFFFFLLGKWKKYRAIKAENVARGMIYAATNTPNGAHIYESDKIKEMANWEKERIIRNPHQAQ
ncbi:NAD(P)H-binding protein [Chitinophaga silvisoli]|uniref:NAD-dependent epimerase/dehydratase family protein n=1 Tax=Chitinophaga silvisoli TaxID=2291814 RepID=A0A3E1NVX7_9BACT|nr:NAD(P)H-binding protein [Chitinophaga silvisoli]RFM32014.1 NAD-dependent epimerase/dehydratase family protein [Chitinophaga silvisoli]